MKIQWSKQKEKGSSARTLFAEKIASGILYAQRHWAAWMSKQVNKISIRTQWVILLLLILCTLCNCTWMIYRAIHKHPSSSKRMPEQLIRVQPLYNGKAKPNSHELPIARDSLPPDSGTSGKLSADRPLFPLLSPHKE